MTHKINKKSVFISIFRIHFSVSKQLKIHVHCSSSNNLITLIKINFAHMKKLPLHSTSSDMYVDCRDKYMYSKQKILK